ncbi:MAG: helix-turn-helix domain-containing protein [Armatimonadota bacterium]
MDEVRLHQGKRMEEARKAARLSSVDMGRIVGRTPQSCRAYERGESQAPSTVLAKWAAATRTEVAWFFQDGTSAAMGEAPQLGRIIHPGVEALADDVELRVDQGVTGELIEMLRSFRGQACGQEMVIRSKYDAVAMMERMKRLIQ